MYMYTSIYVCIYRHIRIYIIYCSVLQCMYIQCVAVCCSVRTLLHDRGCRVVAACCIVLQCVAACCSVCRLLHVGGCTPLMLAVSTSVKPFVFQVIAQHTATQCKTMQQTMQQEASTWRIKTLRRLVIIARFSHHCAGYASLRCLVIIARVSEDQDIARFRHHCLA